MTSEQPCTHPDTWFDRSVCAEPCGSMHDRCTDCGVVVGRPCAIEEAAKQRRDDLRWARERLLEEQAAHLATRERLEALERDNEKLREDLEYLQNLKEDWETEKGRLERELSRVPQDVQRSRGRLVDALTAMGMMPTDALVTVVNLLGTLPGARDFEPVPASQDLYGRPPEEQRADFARASERFSEVRP